MLVRIYGAVATAGGAGGTPAAAVRLATLVDVVAAEMRALTNACV
jgi:hypothetical protein